MSSIPEKSSITREKRSFFMRSGSFEKLKCSAKYPFRVVGVKLSKASVIELAETIIARSRLLSQKLLIVLFIIIYRTLSILVRTSANPLSVVAVCDTENKNNTTLGFYERLQLKVEKLQKHKNRLESLKCSNDISIHKIITEFPKISSSIRTIQQQQQQKQDESLHISQNNRVLSNKNFTEEPINSIDTSKISTITDPIIAVTSTINTNNNNKEYEFHAELKRLREYSVEKSISIIEAKNYYQTERNLNRKNFLQILCLYPLVYGSILLILCQLCVLGFILNSKPITLGYVFLIGSLGYIAYITFKVFFFEKISKITTESKERKSSQLRITDQHKIITNEDNIINTNGYESKIEATSEIISHRQSRSRLKRNIDLSGKTLSKIKLL